MAIGDFTNSRLKREKARDIIGSTNLQFIGQRAIPGSLPISSF